VARKIVTGMQKTSSQANGYPSDTARCGADEYKLLPPGLRNRESVWWSKDNEAALRDVATAAYG